MTKVPSSARWPCVALCVLVLPASPPPGAHNQHSGERGVQGHFALVESLKVYDKIPLLASGILLEALLSNME